MVDWGVTFAIAHARHFPDMSPPKMRMGLGRLAHAFLLDYGGSAYLAERMVHEDLTVGRLHRVQAAPIIKRQVFAVYSQQSERVALLDEVLALLTKTDTGHRKTPASEARTI